jgi:hypothetical protein
MEQEQLHSACGLYENQVDRNNQSQQFNFIIIYLFTVRRLVSAVQPSSSLSKDIYYKTTTCYCFYKPDYIRSQRDGANEN